MAQGANGSGAHGTNQLSPITQLSFYLGGFLGPFGTMLVVPMFPELREHFTTTSEAISWSVSGYMFPMAALLAVSGTIGERYGRRRVLRASFTTYALASTAAVLAPSLTVFMAARIVQGMANAFITPLLIAGLAEFTPEAMLGRRVGVYTSFQATGGGMAPFVGGLAAASDWRLAFTLTAIISVVLAVTAPPGDPRPPAERPPLRSLLDHRLGVLSVALLAATAGPLSVSIIVGFKARDGLAMAAETTGFLLAAGSVAGAIAGPFVGRQVDRFGLRDCSVVAMAGLIPLVVLIGQTDGPAQLAVTYILATVVISVIVVVFQKAGVVIIPTNRGGAMSALMSFRFVGHAIGPLLWVPLFTDHDRLAFAGAAALGLITLAGSWLALPGRAGQRRATVAG